MQESFQERRRASALRSNPTWVLRTLALLLLVFVFVAVFQSLRRPRTGAVIVATQPSAAAGEGSDRGAPAEGNTVPGPGVDRMEKLVFESFSASGRKGVEIEAEGSSGRETESRLLDTVRARIPFVSQGRQASVEIVADHAQHVASRPSALFQGNVKMTTDDGLVLETDELLYDGRDGLAQSEGRVTWRRKDVSGEARGMLYEEWSDSITFFEDVKIRLRDPDDPAADIEADAACLSREANTLFLEGDVTIRQGTNRTASGSLELAFGPDHVIYRAIFRDGFEMVAEGDTRTLGFAFPRASGRKTIRGRRLEMTFGEGRAIEEAAAGPEAVMIVEPGPKDLRERREIRAEALIFKFTPEGKLRQYLGNSGTSVRFVPLTPQAGDLRTISSTDFFANLDPETGEAETVSFVENVVFERKNQLGKGSQAEFSETTGHMVVSGGVTFEDSLALVSLASSNIDIDTQTGSFRAWGAVRHTRKGGLPGAPFGSAGSDLLATSRQVVYDAPGKETQYLGRVVFRAGEDELRALTIVTTDTREGPSISADTEVEVRIGGGPAGAGLAARAGKMTYSPKERAFAFSGAASVTQQDFSTTAPRILVDLLPAGAFGVRRLEADGGVVTIKAKERTAEGTHMLYTPGDGRVEMGGTPVKLEDQGRRVQGKSVVFFTSGDRVEVVGEEGRTETVLQRKIDQP